MPINSLVTYFSELTPNSRYLINFGLTSLPQALLARHAPSLLSIEFHFISMPSDEFAFLIAFETRSTRHHDFTAYRSLLSLFHASRSPLARQLPEASASAQRAELASSHEQAHSEALYRGRLRHFARVCVLVLLSVRCFFDALCF